MHVVFLRVVISKKQRLQGCKSRGEHIYLIDDGGEEGGEGGRAGREGDGRRLVSWLGRIQAVWDRSDLTQPSFSRTGHVRLDLSHTTDIIPLSGETTAHHHSTADRGEREGSGERGRRQ